MINADLLRYFFLMLSGTKTTKQPITLTYEQCLGALVKKCVLRVTRGNNQPSTLLVMQFKLQGA